MHNETFKMDHCKFPKPARIRIQALIALTRDHLRPQQNQDLTSRLAKTLKWTELHRASYNGHAQEVETLLEKPEIAVNATDVQNWTALHYALDNKSTYIVLLLLKNGADASIQTKEGKDAFAIARETQQIDFLVSAIDLTKSQHVHKLEREQLAERIQDLETKLAEQCKQTKTAREEVDYLKRNITEAEMTLEKERTGRQTAQLDQLSFLEQALSSTKIQLEEEREKNELKNIIINSLARVIPGWTSGQLPYQQRSVSVETAHHWEKENMPPDCLIVGNAQPEAAPVREKDDRQPVAEKLERLEIQFSELRRAVSNHDSELRRLKTPSSGPRSACYTACSVCKRCVPAIQTLPESISPNNSPVNGGSFTVQRSLGSSDNAGFDELGSCTLKPSTFETIGSASTSETPLSDDVSSVHQSSNVRYYEGLSSSTAPAVFDGSIQTATEEAAEVSEEGSSQMQEIYRMLDKEPKLADLHSFIALQILHGAQTQSSTDHPQKNADSGGKEGAPIPLLRRLVDWTPSSSGSSLVTGSDMSETQESGE